jgi:hypothetical protein
MGVKMGAKTLGPLLVLRDIASVLAVGVVVSHGVLVLKGSVNSGGLWWVLGGFWCLGFEVSALVSGQVFGSR